MRALRGGEAERGKGRERRPVLDADGGCLKAARGGERKAAADKAETGVTQAARKLDDRRAADFHFIEAVAVQEFVGDDNGAAAVERGAEAEAAQLADDPGGRLTVADECAFGHFEDQSRGVEAAFAEDAVEIARQALVGEVGGAEIDRERPCGFFGVGCRRPFGQHIGRG